MNAALDDLTSFEIIDRTGRDSARAIVDDATHSDLDGASIGAAAGHAVRVGLDPEILAEWLNRDYADMVVPGMPSIERPGKTRRYVVGDLERIMKTARFRALLKQAKADERAHEQLLARQERERVADAKRVDREVGRERELCPHLWALVEELQAEVATLRGERHVRGNGRHPLLVE